MEHSRIFEEIFRETLKNFEKFLRKNIKIPGGESALEERYFGT